MMTFAEVMKEIKSLSDSDLLVLYDMANAKFRTARRLNQKSAIATYSGAIHMIGDMLKKRGVK